MTSRVADALGSVDRVLDLSDRTRETVSAHGWHGLTRVVGSVAERLSEAREHLAAAEPPFASADALLREISELLSRSEVAERFIAAAEEVGGAREALEASSALVDTALRQAAAAVIADLEVSLHALRGEIEDIAQGAEQCRTKIEDEGRRAEQFGAQAGTSGSGLGLAEVTTRIQDLRQQGHGPQRHGAGVTDHVHGVRRDGSVNHPTGNPPGSMPPADADFTDGSMVAVYKEGPDGIERLHTMYPDPKKANE